MIVKEFMNTNVVSIDSDASVKDAAGKMAQHDVGSLIATERGKPAGIVTERDLLSRVVAAGKDTKTTHVKDIMSKPLICGTPAMDVVEATRFMIDKGIKKLPIAEDGKLVGIVTLTDTCSAQPDMYDLLVKESEGKLPKRFMKRLAKRYYRT